MWNTEFVWIIEEVNILNRSSYQRDLGPVADRLKQFFRTEGTRFDYINFLAEDDRIWLKYY